MKGMSWEEQYRGYWRDVEWHLASQIKNQPYLLHWIMSANPHSILEVGAGTGKVCALTKRLLPEAKVVATDISPTLCRGMKKFMRAAKVDVEVECRDLFHLPYKDLSFDICFSIGVMEHFSIEDFKLGLGEQLRVARIVLIDLPLLHWFMERRSSQGDELVMPKATWIALLMESGWILDISFTGLPLEEDEMIVAVSLCPGASLYIAKDVTTEVNEAGKLGTRRLK